MAGGDLPRIHPYCKTAKSDAGLRLTAERLWEPLADGVSPKQGLDKNGPAAVLKSVASINHAAFRNGTLLKHEIPPGDSTG